MVEFYHCLLDRRQKVLFVRQSEGVDYGPVQEILSARPREDGVRLTTERGQFRVEWGQVRLITAGNVRESRGSENSDLLAELFVDAPRRHLRLVDTTFNYRSWGMEHPEPGKAFREFVLSWREQCPESAFSHTIELVARGKTEEFQVFSSLTEFENYNRWLLLAHLGEQIDPARKRSKIATNY
jgi:hypothetical protein